MSCQFLSNLLRTHSAGAVKYTDCMSAEESNTPKECPDMNQNYLMAKLQFWRFEK